MRGLHGKSFEESLLGNVVWVANRAPKYDGDDVAVRRHTYAESADATFVNDLAHPCAPMVFLGFAREFADPSSEEYIRKPHTLPAEPVSKASGARGGFERFSRDHLKSGGDDE